MRDHDDSTDPLDAEELESLDEVTHDDTPGLDTDPVDMHELPGADLSHETLRVQVIPVQEDEFTCTRCFLVNHQTRMAGQDANGSFCIDCD